MLFFAANEFSFQNSLEIYPNPNNGVFKINLNKTENVSITVYDLIGSKIKLFENINSFPIQINLNELSDGVYYVKINTDNKSVTKKIVITK